MSSALKIATAKCVHWSYCLSTGGYKLPQCSQWIPNIPLSFSASLYLSLYLSHSFLFLRPVWCMISFVCLSPPIIMLFELLSLQHGSIKALLSTGSRRAHIACRAAPVNSVSTEVGINIFRPIQMIQGWCRLLLQITLCPINTYIDAIIWNTRKECKRAQWHWEFEWLWMCECICLVFA